tara:strand:- start:399 stop:9788 length:9390 start_codon:yes stop_codon:yes gene_type:complete
VAVGQQIPSEDFAPSLSKQQTENLIKAYESYPNRYKDIVEDLRFHAHYYNVPFYEGEFSIGEAIKQAGAGFMEGFTTFNMADPPKNEYTGIARSLGHLIGFAPGILAGPLGWASKGLAAAGMINKAQSVASAAKAVSGVKSWPLYLSEKIITPKAGKIANNILKSNAGNRYDSFKSAKDFLLSPQTKNLAEGAFNLGTASAISSWQHAVDGGMGVIIDSFKGGAVAGGVFRAIGNLIGKNVPGGKQYPIPMESQKAEKWVRALAGSAFMGIPSTLRGSTTPEQIYEYLLGAYFGGNEKPWTRHRAQKIFSEKVQPAAKKDVVIEQTMDAERVKGIKWESIEPEVKTELREMAKEWTGSYPEDKTAAAYELAKREKPKLFEKENVDIEKEVFEHQKKDITKKALKLKKEVTKLTKKLTGEKEKEDIVTPDVAHVLTSGKKGIESIFSQEVEKRGVSTIQLLSGQDSPKTAGKGKLTEKTVLGSEILDKGTNAIRQAIKDLKLTPQETKKLNTDVIKEGLKRDFAKVDFADSVIIFDSVNPTLKGTRGVTKYATQMAINRNKPTFVFDANMKNGQWFKYNPETTKFEVYDKIPQLPQIYSVFGGKTFETGSPTLREREARAVQDLLQKYDKEGFKEVYEQERKKLEEANPILSETPDTAERLSTNWDNKIMYSMHEYFQKKLKKELETPFEINQRIAEMSKRASELAEDYIFRGDRTSKEYKHVRSEEWFKAIEQELGIEIEPRMRGELRQWMTRQQKGVPVRIVQASELETGIADISNPYTLSGERKLLIEPTKEIEKVYRDLVKKMPEEGMFALWDTITIGNRDVEISRLREYLQFERNLSEAEAIKEAKKIRERKIEDMRVLYNMHPYSGAGDKGRVIFVKYHPNYKKVKVKLPKNYENWDSNFAKIKDWKNVVKSNIAYDLSLNNKTKVEEVMEPGYIGNASGFNKRTQIWNTSGYSGDKQFILNWAKENNVDLKLNKNGNYKGSLIDDPVKVKNILKANNVEIPEGFDGAILATERIVDVMNLDAGMPYTGSNKSFLILRDPKHGTTLGKYMVHKVHPEMSKMMEAYNNGEGLNMLIMKSSIKQLGDRGLKPGSYDLKGDKLNLYGDANNIVEIDPSAFKYSYSVKNGPELTKGTHKIYKQLMSIPHSRTFKETNQKVINDWYQTFAQESYNGQKVYNDLILKLRDEVSPSKKQEYRDVILENFDKLGVNEVLKVLRTPGEELLAQEMLLKIVKTNKEAIETLSMLGELSGSDLEQQIQGLGSFTQTADRIIKNTAALGNEAFPMMFDVYSKPYIEKALSSWVSDKVFNPKVNNSLEARMRPYDIYLQKLFPELNSDKAAQGRWGKNADELFYLGDLFKKTPIETTIPKMKNTTLGELWEKYDNGKLSKANMKKAEEVFEALNVRVPQDAMSGAQILHFRGFTGIQDHGILQHGRVLRALGGADLDGDHATVYFGSPKMKKAFKDMFRNQKEEFVTEKGELVDVKEMFENELLEKDPKRLKELGLPKDIVEVLKGESKKHPYAKYYPGLRMRAGDIASEGRNAFSSIVSMTQNMRAAWNSVSDAPGGKEILSEGKILGKGKKPDILVRIVNIAKKPSTRQRLLTTGMTAFGADPMDHTGLKTMPELKSILQDAYFDKQIEVYSPNLGKWVKAKNQKLPKSGIKLTPNENTAYNVIYKINSAFYSRNWNENRKWTTREQIEMAQGIKSFSNDMINSALPKFAKTVEDLNLSIDIFSRLNRKGLENLYETANAEAGKLGYLKRLLGRNYLKTPESNEVKAVVELGLGNSNIVNLKSKNPKEIVNLLKEKYNVDLGLGKVDLRYINPKKVAEALDALVERANWKLFEDLHDMTTVKLLNKEISKNEVPEDIIKQMSRVAEAAKQLSKAQQYNRNGKGRDFENPEKIEKDKAKALSVMNEIILREIFGMPSLAKARKTLKRTKLLDQADLDLQIKNYKDTLPNDTARKIFDYLLIGSLRNSNTTNRFRKILKNKKMPKDLKETVLDMIRNDGNKTSSNKLAYESEAVNPVSIQEFIKTKNQFFRKGNERNKTLETEVLNEVDNQLENINPRKNIFNEVIKPQNDLNETGYEGLKPGTLDKKALKEITELQLNLQQLEGYEAEKLNEHIMGVYAAAGDGLTSKNLNQMNVADFQKMNAWFRLHGRGTAAQQHKSNMERIKAAGLKASHQYKFVQQVTREQLASDAIWIPKTIFLQTKDKSFIEKKIKVPTYFGEILRNQGGTLTDIKDGFEVFLADKFDSRIGFLTQAKDGEAIYEFAMRLYERRHHKQEIYQTQLEEAIERINWSSIRNKEYLVDVDGTGKRESYTGRQLAEITIDKYKKFMDKFHRDYITGHEGAINEYWDGTYFDKAGTQKRLDWRKFMRKLEYAMNHGDDTHIIKSLNIGIDGMRMITKAMLIDLAPVTEYVGLKGKNKGKLISADKWFQLPMYKKKFWRPSKEKTVKDLENMDILPTNYREGYVPHHFLNQKHFKEAYKRAIEKVDNDASMTTEQKITEKAKLKIAHHNKTGDLDLSDFHLMESQDKVLFKDALVGVGDKQLQTSLNSAMSLGKANHMFNNMNRREFHTGGYEVGPEATHIYLKNAARTAFRQLQYMASRKTLNDMRKRLSEVFVTGSKEDKIEGRKLVNSWLAFWTNYAKNGMGMPTIVTDAMMADPSYQLGNTLAGKWADNRVANWVNNALEMLGFAKNPLKDLDAKQAARFTKSEKETLKQIVGKDAFDMHKFSRLEAQFELATLMTHPKTPINNVFGGSAHTFQKVGYQAYKKVRDYEYLKTISPELGTRQGVLKFVEQLGVLPDMIRHQFGIESPEFKRGKGLSFATDLANQAKGVSDIKNIDVLGIAKKHGIGKKLMNIASKFVSAPERMLRADAFMAQYIAGYERLGGSITNLKHPVLVQYAKRAVQATQFLYNQLERPAFARSALGQVFSRFQLWSWNAVRFRNDIRKEALLYGFKPGTEAMRRFERTMQVDMMIMALGTLFMYSMFGQVIPAPYNWLQDSAEWLFGDEKTREKAFFGEYPGVLAPLKIISPPIARIPMSLIRELMENDNDRLAKYYIYTMMPFGRMIKDVSPYSDNNLWENPSRLPEKLIGFPLQSISREKKKLEKGVYKASSIMGS